MNTVSERSRTCICFSVYMCTPILDWVQENKLPVHCDVVKPSTALRNSVAGNHHTPHLSLSRSVCFCIIAQLYFYCFLSFWTGRIAFLIHDFVCPITVMHWFFVLLKWSKSSNSICTVGCAHFQFLMEFSL